MTEQSSRDSMRQYFAPTEPARTPYSREELANALAKVARGDHDALETVYKLTSAKLFALLRRMLPEEITEEVLQDVYMTVWKKASSYDVSLASPMTWLMSIARNKAIDQLRKNPSLKSVSLDEVVMHLRDPAPSALNHLEEKDRLTHLTRCLDELDVRHRTVIRAAFFGGITYEELAERTAVPLGTMKSWIRRGLIRLKNCLEP